jgi:2'-5' RNA ligase
VKLAVVSYPDLRPADRRWIDAIRFENDPQARRLGVHFTLVFPFEGEPTPLAEEIDQAVRGTRQIAFEIGEVRVVPDMVTSQSHVFLVPNQGYQEISAFHERLYKSKSLCAHNRRDIPYIPHLTVAAHPTVPSAESCAQTFRLQMADQNVVRGTLSTMDLVDLSSQVVRTVARFRLERMP